MDWTLLLVMVPLVVLCWWAGFFATKRFRLAKNAGKGVEQQPQTNADS